MSPYIKVFLHTKIKHNHVVGKYELTILVAMSNALWYFLFIKPKVSHKMSTERKWNLFFRICYTPLKVEIMKIQNSYFLLLNWKKIKQNHMKKEGSWKFSNLQDFIFEHNTFMDRHMFVFWFVFVYHIFFNLFIFRFFMFCLSN